LQQGRGAIGEGAGEGGEAVGRQGGERRGGVGGGVAEQLAAGAGVAEGEEGAGGRGAAGCGVVLVGRDDAGEEADLGRGRWGLGGRVCRSISFQVIICVLAAST
jgi:hypothetical protein